MSKRVFFILWTLCVVGSWSVIPYILHLGVLPAEISTVQFFIFKTVESLILFGFACWLSYLLLPKTDLSPFPPRQAVKRAVLPSVISGVLLGLTLCFLNSTVFASSALAGTHPPLWTGLLGSMYGAINEEVLLRLFFFTFVYFIFGRVVSVTPNNRQVLLWLTNVIVAIAFGLGHLPAAYQLVSPSSFETSRILILNAIPGLVFGWLYWSRGIYAAMLSHLVTDFMIHGFLI